MLLQPLFSLLRLVLRTVLPGHPWSFDASLLQGLRPAARKVYLQALQDFQMWLKTKQCDPLFAHEIDRASVDSKNRAT